MRFCTNCGHRLGVGRYCTNCGARVPLPTADPTGQADNPTMVRTSTFEPIPAADPVSADPAAPPAPPPLGPPPPGARYPLFADTVQPPANGQRPEPAQPAPYAAPPARRRSLLPWLIGLLALAVIAVIAGGLLVLAPSGSEEADDPKPAAHDDGRRGDGDGAEADPSEVLAPADVSVPGTAPASVDEDGNPVTFEAQNMLDADPRTSWRMAGDGSGAVITFRYDDPVTVTEVGLINGYAKTDPPHDWYAGNRRIGLVEWVFDDGTVVAQELGDDPSMQTVPVDADETTSVELRIVEVSEPGSGPDGRDFTAISGVELTGYAD
jgi:hypothetical protein